MDLPTKIKISFQKIITFSSNMESRKGKVENDQEGRATDCRL